MLNFAYSVIFVFKFVVLFAPFVESNNWGGVFDVFDTAGRPPQRLFMENPQVVVTYPDGSFVLKGESESESDTRREGKFDSFARISASGEIEWSKTFERPSTEGNRNVDVMGFTTFLPYRKEEGEDEDFFINGVFPEKADPKELKREVFYLSRIDGRSGEVKWAKFFSVYEDADPEVDVDRYYYSHHYTLQACFLLRSSDESTISVIHHTTASSHQGENLLVMKFTNDGELQWKNSINGFRAVYGQIKGDRIFLIGHGLVSHSHHPLIIVTLSINDGSILSVVSYLVENKFYTRTNGEEGYIFKRRDTFRVLEDDSILMVRIFGDEGVLVHRINPYSGEISDGKSIRVIRSSSLYPGEYGSVTRFKDRIYDHDTYYYSINNQGTENRFFFGFSLIFWLTEDKQYPETSHSMVKPNIVEVDIDPSGELQIASSVEIKGSIFKKKEMNLDTFHTEIGLSNSCWGLKTSQKDQFLLYFKENPPRFTRNPLTETILVNVDLESEEGYCRAEKTGPEALFEVGPNSGIFLSKLKLKFDEKAKLSDFEVTEAYDVVEIQDSRNSQWEDNFREPEEDLKIEMVEPVCLDHSQSLSQLYVPLVLVVLMVFSLLVGLVVILVYTMKKRNGTSVEE